MTRLDLFTLASTLLVFFSLIEVMVTIVLDHREHRELLHRIDCYCRFIFPAVFLVASLFIFMPGRAG